MRERTALSFSSDIATSTAAWSLGDITASTAAWLRGCIEATATARFLEDIAASTTASPAKLSLSAHAEGSIGPQQLSSLLGRSS